MSPKISFLIVLSWMTIGKSLEIYFTNIIIWRLNLFWEVHKEIISKQNSRDTNIFYTTYESFTYSLELITYQMRHQDNEIVNVKYIWLNHIFFGTLKWSVAFNSPLSWHTWSTNSAYPGVLYQQPSQPSYQSSCTSRSTHEQPQERFLQS